jgi:Zn-dependent protease with chaperone function
VSLAALALPLVALALALAAGWLTATLLAAAWLALVQRAPQLDSTAPAVFVLPWLVGLAMMLAAVLPGDPHAGTVLACHCLASMPDWFHLCPVHPERAWPLAAPALTVLALLFPRRLTGLRALMRLPLGRGGSGPEVVPLASPVAVLHGWWRPTLVVDSRLWAALPPPERQAVLAHEQAHLDRRDPQLMVLLRLLLVLAPPALAHRVARRWLAGAEHRADSAAAATVGDPSLVAMALVRCARLGSPEASLAPGWTAGSVEDRVHRLLDSPGAGVPARPDLRGTHLIALGALLVAGLSAVPWLHHQLEHLLNHSL